MDEARGLVKRPVHWPFRYTLDERTGQILRFVACDEHDERTYRPRVLVPVLRCSRLTIQISQASKRGR